MDHRGGEKLPFTYFTPFSTFPLRLSPIRLAQPQLEPNPAREVQHARVPLVITSLVITLEHHNLGVVVQAAPGYSPEVLEGVQVTP